MKKVFTIILTTLFFTGCIGQTQEEQSFKEINAPNFLIQNQLSPELLKIEYTGCISNGSFESNAGNKTSLKQSTFTISGYPVTLKSKRYTQFYLGFGYTKEKFVSLDGQVSEFIGESYESINLNFFANTRIRNMLFWFLYVQVGTQGTTPFSDLKNNNNEILLTKINYKAKRNMNLGFGFAYVTNLGKPLILPALAFVYSDRHYLVNIDFPIKAEIEGIFASGKLRPVAGISFPASTYYLKDSNGYFNTSGMTGYIGMRYRALDFLYLYAALQQGLKNTFSFGDRGNWNEVGSFDGQSRLTLSLNVQVARFIPHTREPF